MEKAIKEKKPKKVKEKVLYGTFCEIQGTIESLDDFNPNVLFIVDFTEKNGKNFAFSFLQHFIRKEGFTLNKDAAIVSLLEIDRELMAAAGKVGFSEREKTSLLKEAYKIHYTQLIEVLKPDFVVVVGERLGNKSIFPKTIRRECIANKRSNSYRSIFPDRIFFYLEDPSLIAAELEEVQKGLKVDSILHENCANTFKSIRNIFDAGLDRKNVDYTLVDSEEKLLSCYDLLKQQTFLSVDIETTGLDAFSDTAKVITISFSYKEEQGVCFPMYHPETEGLFTEEELEKGIIDNIVTLVKDLLVDPNIVKVLHNGKFDTQYIYQTLGIHTASYKHDSMIAHYCINEMAGTHKLKRLANQYTDLGAYDEYLDAYRKENKIEHLGYEHIPLDVLWVYNCCDTDATLRLHNIFQKEIEKDKCQNLYQHLLNINDTLFDIEQNGFVIDKNYLKTLEEEYPVLILEARREFFDMPEVLEVQELLQQKENEENKTPEVIEFDPMATNHIKKLLWEHLKLQQFLHSSNVTEFFTKKGKVDLGDLRRAKNVDMMKIPIEYLSSGKDTLEVLEKQNIHPVVSKLMTLRKLIKLYGTYIAPVREEWHSSDDKVHSTMLVVGTSTGRLTSSNPNMQNIPRGAVIKNMFISRFEGGLFGQLDYSQAELRIAAALSGDSNMIRAFIAGLDFHKATAALMFNKDIHDVLKEERQKSKAINFGILYLKSAASLSLDLGCSVDEAEEFIDVKYFGGYPKLKEWIEDTKNFVKANGYTESKFGRKRRFERVPRYAAYERKLKGLQRFYYNSDIRESVNHPIQSTAAEFALLSTIFIQKYLKASNFKSCMFGTVYDSIMFDLHPDEAAEVMENAKLIMENLAYFMEDYGLFDLSWLKIKMDDGSIGELKMAADAEIGKCWGKLSHVVFDGSVPDVETEKYWDAKTGLFWKVNEESKEWGLVA